MIWFTSDEHYYHHKIIMHCDRPFKDINQMHKILIDNHNELVSDSDTVYHVGDFAFPIKNRIELVGAITKRLNGKHVLILGNHDEGKAFSYTNHGFATVHTGLELDKHNLWLHHDPCVFDLLPDDYWLVCGHVHKLFHVLKRVINVGVDVNKFKPVSLDTINSIRGEE